MTNVKNEGNPESQARFIGFTRDEIALGTAGFVAGLDVAAGTLVPGRVSSAYRRTDCF